VAVASSAAIAGYGSGTGKNDEISTADVFGFPLQLFGGFGAIYDRKLSIDHRADQIDKNSRKCPDGKYHPRFDAAV
jgi:hypothetical protein